MKTALILAFCLASKCTLIVTLVGLTVLNVLAISLLLRGGSQASSCKDSSVCGVDYQCVVSA